MKSFESISSNCNVTPLRTKNMHPGTIKRTLISRPRISRPGLVQRSMSLPAKLEQAPRTKKLFWFRPDVSFLDDDGKEARLKRASSTLDEQRERRDFIRSTVYPPSFENDSTCDGSSNGDFMEDLVGLGILADE